MIQYIKFPGSGHENAKICMSDTPKQIKDKINKHAFSGGKVTKEEHQKWGGDPGVDISFQYLRYLEDDDNELASIAKVSHHCTILAM